MEELRRNQKVTFSSSSNTDTCGILYDSKFNQLAISDDISAENLDFSFEYELKANKTYIVGIRGGADESIGTSSLSILSEFENVHPISTTTGSVWTTTLMSGYSNYKYGEQIILPPVPERKGYKFIGWFDENGNEWHDGDLILSEASLTLIAKWEEIL